MKQATTTSSPAVSLNHSKTKKGKERRKQILEACKRVLAKEGCMRFQLRNVAVEAGLSLSNVQYYFPTKEELVKGLGDDIEEFYIQEASKIYGSQDETPINRFLIMMDYLINMVKDPETRYFWIQLWAFIGAIDPDRGKFLSEIYLTDIANIKKVVQDINPLLSKGALQQRSTIIAAMIEGMMLMLDDADVDLEEDEQSIEIQLKKQALRIAMDP